MISVSIRDCSGAVACTVGVPNWNQWSIGVCAVWNVGELGLFKGWIPAGARGARFL